MSLSVLVSSGYLPRSGIAGSHGGFIPSFLGFFLFLMSSPQASSHLIYLHS